MKLAKAATAIKKHTGEKKAGINVQMRFVPLKPKGEEKEPETDSISVAIDENHRADGANELKVTITLLNNLHGQGVQFLDNMITLTQGIFEPKGCRCVKDLNTSPRP
ncbi:predicted protein [Chaetoceros tenuissimus]|uniref:Uncharacterized protein n=1 Tax=Chaetoceros tenuissimus TaxID=426638 RepID=A0AAD3CTD7_9STRA|nr:predicted protein [Chaetoceros tenuissimus]